jgi:hypothetical protein
MFRRRDSRPATAESGGVADPRARAALPRRLRTIAALIVGASLCGSLLANSGPQDEVSRRDWGIAGFRPPPRWDLLPRDRSSYPQLLAWASRGEGTERAVITLVARRVPLGTTYETLLREARALKVRRAETVQVRLEHEVAQRRVLVEADLQPTNNERRQALRQILLLNPPFAYVLTLVAPHEQRQARQRDLEEIVSNLSFLPPPEAELPVLPKPAPPDGGTPPLPAPSAPDGGAGPADAARRAPTERPPARPPARLPERPAQSD